jgi:hypothetical protein
VIVTGGPDPHLRRMVCFDRYRRFIHAVRGAAGLQSRAFGSYIPLRPDGTREWKERPSVHIGKLFSSPAPGDLPSRVWNYYVLLWMTLPIQLKTVFLCMSNSSASADTP